MKTCATSTLLSCVSSFRKRSWRLSSVLSECNKCSRFHCLSYVDFHSCISISQSTFVLSFYQTPRQSIQLLFRLSLYHSHTQYSATSVCVPVGLKSFPLFALMSFARFTWDWLLWLHGPDLFTAFSHRSLSRILVAYFWTLLFPSCCMYWAELCSQQWVTHGGTLSSQALRLLSSSKKEAAGEYIPPV